MAALAEEAAWDTAEAYPFRLPHDLRYNFAAAGRRRPEVYLDPDVRAGMSAFALAEPRAVEEGVGRLRRDLAVGAWRARHGGVLELEDFDAGYRFLRISPAAQAGGSSGRPAGAGYHHFLAVAT